MRALAALVAASLLAGCAATDENALLTARRAWWAEPGRALDVATLAPLERVPGRPGAPLPTTGEDATAALSLLAPARNLALLVWYKGALRIEHYGPGFGPDSLSAPASMPKPVLALAVGAAVDRGLVDIDAPVSRWIGEWRGDPRGAITLRQALQMRTGLAKYGAATDGGKGEALMLGTRLEQVVLAAPLVREPGSLFDYSNTDSALATLVLERATGKRYAHFLSETVWQAIGAGDAFAWLDRPHGLARTFCCLLARPRDWLRVGLLIKDGGQADGRQVLSPEWIAAMTAPSPANASYGMHIWRGSPHVAHRSYGSGAASPLPIGAPFAAPDMLIFDGAVGQRIYVSRAQDLVIVRIGDSIPDWEDSRLPNSIVAGLESSLPAAHVP